MTARARVVVPVDLDRSPRTTVMLAAAIARQAGAEVEFVARADAADQDLLTRSCADAIAAGAPKATFAVLAPGDGDVGAYATWSGSALMCLSTGRHEHIVRAGWAALLHGAAVPLLVLGPRGDPSRDGYARVVVGLDGCRPRPDLLSASSALSGWLGIPLVLTQVLAPTTRPTGDVVESGYLHRVAGTVAAPDTSFDTLHASHPATGLLRFVGRDDGTIVAIGAAHRRHRATRLGRVVASLVHRSTGPVLVVPACVPAWAGSPG